MRIVHTSDWHAGRVWKGVDRLPELAAVLDQLGRFLEDERIDLLLMSGDVFDSGAPQPRAEKLVFEFFKRIGQAGTQSVVIAGNHDSPARLQAWGILTALVNVYAVGHPCRSDKGGVLDLAVRSGERARVAAVPFARPHLLVSALDLAREETRVREKYDQVMRAIIQSLTTSFREDTVNLLMAHTHLQGAVISGSERLVHLGEQWATTREALPASAHYVALGHIHKPQRVEGAPCPAFYAGSPLQLDFGEEGEKKSFLLVEVVPGHPARVERVPYEGGKPLVTVRASIEELERDAGQLRDAGWLRVTVPMTSADPDINGNVRRILPNAVIVTQESSSLPEKSVSRKRPSPGSSPRDLYRAYCLARYRQEPSSHLVEAFEDLLLDSEQGAASSDPGA